MSALRPLGPAIRAATTYRRALATLRGSKGGAAASWAPERPYRSYRHVGERYTLHGYEPSPPPTDPAQKGAAAAGVGQQLPAGGGLAPGAAAQQQPMRAVRGVPPLINGMRLCRDRTAEDLRRDQRAASGGSSDVHACCCRDWGAHGGASPAGAGAGAGSDGDWGVEAVQRCSCSCCHEARLGDSMAGGRAGSRKGAGGVAGAGGWAFHQHGAYEEAFRMLLAGAGAGAGSGARAVAARGCVR